MFPFFYYIIQIWAYNNIFIASKERTLGKASKFVSKQQLYFSKKIISLRALFLPQTPFSVFISFVIYEHRLLNIPIGAAIFVGEKFILS